jgi:hypothetical protein
MVSESTKIGSVFATLRSGGILPVRKLVPVFLLVFLVATNSFAAPNVLRASAIPEPGVLLALSGGLIGLATLIRNRLSK